MNKYNTNIFYELKQNEFDDLKNKNRMSTKNKNID